jgi:hypothetical protein
LLPTGSIGWVILPNEESVPGNAATATDSSPASSERPTGRMRNHRARQAELKHRRNRRAVISLMALGVVLAIGTIGFHAVAGTKRGAHRALTLERLEALREGATVLVTTGGAPLRYNAKPDILNPSFVAYGDPGRDWLQYFGR